jgi:hypothetical protein
VTHGDRYTIGGPTQAILLFGDQDAGSYVNGVVGNSARLSGRYHCGLDRRAWIWADASD